MPIETALPSLSPRVTVLLPCHRADNYLQQAIASVLQQSMPNFELLIIADARLLGQEEKILQFACGDPRVSLLPSLVVGGLAAGLNLGISRAKGDYIARMDSDDICLRDRLAVQAQYMDEHEDIAALGAKLELIDESGIKLDRSYPFYETDKEIRSILPMRNPMPHPALMFRKKVLLAVGGYKYAHSAEDWELFIRIARDRSYRLQNLNQVLVQYRRHASQITRPELTSAVFYETSAFLFSEFLRTASPKYLAGIFIKLPWLVHMRLALRRFRAN